MRITAMDAKTKKTLPNTKIQLQIRGQNSGILSVTTDQNGFINIDDQYMGQQLLGSLGSVPAGAHQGGTQGQWLAAVEGATLFVFCEKNPATTGSHK